MGGKALECLQLQGLLDPRGLFLAQGTTVAKGVPP